VKLLITSGPTREYLDTVRYLSNPSSGRMGFALARAASRRGHDVTVVTGPVAIREPRGVRIIRVTTAAEMLNASLSAFVKCHAAIFAAAVCDYRPSRRDDKKKPKRAGAWRVALEPTTDIAAALGRVKRHRITVAFALEDHNARPNAEGKLARKSADAIVLNGPANIGDDRARVEVLTAGGDWVRWPIESKAAIATRLIRLVERLANRERR
jgi:phosphopantothenoylcysteine decarboxylase/phosphopantothenate--cysteine ligase